MKKLLLILALCCLSLPAYATTYYMRGDGTVTAANKANATGCGATTTAMNVTQHNAATFAAGDTIKLCDTGGSFTDAILTPPSSGSSVSYITYTNSGSPVIDGAITVTGWAADTGYVQEQSYASSPSTVNYETFGDGAASTYMALQFTASSSYTLTRADIGICKVSGSPESHAVHAAIYSDAGSGPVTNLGAATATRQDTLTTSCTVGPASYWTFTWTGVNLTSGSKYDVVLWTTVDASNKAAFQVITSGPGSWASSNGTSWSSWDGSRQGTYNLYETGAVANVYTVAMATQPNQVFLAGAWMTQGSSCAALTQHQWFWTGGTLCFYESGGNPDTHSDVITASQLNYGVNSNAQNYLTFHGLTIEHENLHGIFLSGNTTGLVISGNDISFSYGVGIRNDSSTTYTLTASTITGNTIHQNGASGIVFLGSGVTNNTVTNNSLSYNDQQYSATGNDHTYGGGLYFWTVGSGNVVTKNISFRNGFLDSNTSVGTSTSYGAGLWFDTVATGNTLSYNVVHDNNFSGIRVEDSSSISLLYDVTYNNSNATNYSAGIQVESYNGLAANSSNLIYGNTAYGNYYGLDMTGYGTPTAATCTNNLVKNNIFTGSTAENLYVQLGCQNDGTDGSGNVYTYNSFGTAAASFIYWGSAGYATYALWEAAAGNCGTGGCSHSIQTAPTFVATGSGNFALASGSSAIDAATALGATYLYGLSPLSSWPSSVLLLPQSEDNSGWDIGAYVYPKHCIVCDMSCLRWPERR